MQCNYYCYRDTRLFSKTEPLFNEFLWPQASTIVSLYCLYLWQHLLASKFFAHDLTWQARQLVHTGDDLVSPKSPKKPDTEKLKEGINTLSRELLGLPFQRASQP